METLDQSRNGQIGITGELQFFIGVAADRWGLANALKNSLWTKKEPTRLIVAKPPFDVAWILRDDSTKEVFGFVRVLRVNVEGNVEEDLSITGRCFSVGHPPAPTRGRANGIQETLDAVVRCH